MVAATLPRRRRGRRRRRRRLRPSDSATILLLTVAAVAAAAAAAAAPALPSTTTSPAFVVPPGRVGGVGGGEFRRSGGGRRPRFPPTTTAPAAARSPPPRPPRSASDDDDDRAEGAATAAAPGEETAAAEEAAEAEPTDAEDDAPPSVEAADDDDAEIPPFVSSPVLRAAYPALARNVREYGHANIPLGSADGRRCKTLRRLQFQGKLTEEETSLLSDMNFRFRSFEDVYDEADFDDCLERLIEYENEHNTGYQIPKKYPPDPELGAWVTLIRRIRRDGIDAERRERLDAIGFAWESTRKCGSSFMRAYRPLLMRLEAAAKDGEGGETAEEVLAEEGTARWLRAQREAFRRGNLSESRVGYLDKLPGVNWRELP